MEISRVRRLLRDKSHDVEYAEPSLLRAESDDPTMSLDFKPFGKLDYGELGLWTRTYVGAGLYSRNTAWSAS